MNPGEQAWDPMDQQTIKLKIIAGIAPSPTHPLLIFLCALLHALFFYVRSVGTHPGTIKVFGREKKNRHANKTERRGIVKKAAAKSRRGVAHFRRIKLTVKMQLVLMSLVPTYVGLAVISANYLWKSEVLLGTRPLFLFHAFVYKKPTDGKSSTGKDPAVRRGREEIQGMNG